MKDVLIATGILLLSAFAHAERHFPSGVEIDVPPQVFTESGQGAQHCNQCCIYENKNYSEGAVIKVESLLLQCQRDTQALSTHPLAWRRVTP